MPQQIFLSYSRSDTLIMQRVRDQFQETGLTVWTDEKIQLGTPSWKLSIETAILESNCLMVILSPDANRSKWVREEINFAENHKKKIYTILAIGDEQSSVPFGYSTSQWIDIRDQSRFDTEISRLITAIKNYLEIMSNDGNALAILPSPFEWCEIPSGKILIGKSKESGELRNNIQTVEHFFLAKYPVTNAQYQIFIDAQDGYTNESWWDFNQNAMDWRKKHVTSNNSAFVGDDCPRENITWFDAKAFCRWLGYKTQLTIDLPSHMQRLRAVKCEDNRIYPWGNNFELNRCNVRESMFKRTTSVYKYPEGSNIYGVNDLSGNVWEWSGTTIDTQKLRQYTTIGYLIHGGSWRGRHRHTKGDFIRGQYPDYFAPDIGFRICMP